MEEPKDTIGHGEAYDKRERPSWVGLKTKAGKKCKRLPLACATCRRKKIKCSGEVPACERCLKARVVCFYQQKGRRNVHSKNEHGSFACDARRLREEKFESQRTEATHGKMRDGCSGIYKQELDDAVPVFNDGGTEGKDENGNDISVTKPFGYGDCFSTFPSGRELSDQMQVTTTMSERAHSRTTADFSASRSTQSTAQGYINLAKARNIKDSITEATKARAETRQHQVHQRQSRDIGKIGPQENWPGVSVPPIRRNSILRQQPESVSKRSCPSSNGQFLEFSAWKSGSESPRTDGRRGLELKCGKLNDHLGPPVQDHDGLPLECSAGSTFRMTPVHSQIYPHPSLQSQTTAWSSFGNSSFHSSTTGMDSMSCDPAVTSANDQILSGVHNETCAAASDRLDTPNNVNLRNHGQHTTSLMHAVVGLDAQGWQNNESEGDCVEDLSARKALQQANMPRRVRSRVHKLQPGRSPVANEVLKLRAELAQQMERNSKLVEKFERLRQQDRRRREALKKGRQAVLQLCQEHATSSTVASLDDEVEIPHLIVKLRERLNRKHKMHHDNLQRVRKQKNDLHCALEHYRAEDLKVCQDTIKQTCAVPSTTLQTVATDTSIDHQMPTCGHPIAWVVSYTACGRLLCEACTDNLREGIAVEEWVMDCHWCRRSCAVHAIPHQLRLSWTARWHNAVKDLTKAESSLAQMMW